MKFSDRPGTRGVKISNREGEGYTVGDGRTDERLGNQPANGTRQPHQRRELLRQSQTQQERGPISIRSRKHSAIRDTPAAKATQETKPKLKSTHPSSTVQAICAPAIEILRNIKSFVDNLFF